MTPFTMYVNVNIYPAKCTAVMSFTTKVINTASENQSPLEDKSYITSSTVGVMTKKRTSGIF